MNPIKSFSQFIKESVSNPPYTDNTNFDEVFNSESALKLKDLGFEFELIDGVSYREPKPFIVVSLKYWLIEGDDVAMELLAKKCKSFNDDAARFSIHADEGLIEPETTKISNGNCSATIKTAMDTKWNTESLIHAVNYINRCVNDLSDSLWIINNHPINFRPGIGSDHELRSELESKYKLHSTINDLW